jgi:hypothetical protein
MQVYGDDEFPRPRMEKTVYDHEVMISRKKEKG